MSEDWRQGWEPDNESPGKGTTRPYRLVVQPRAPSQRQQMRGDRDSDGPHALRIKWLKAVQQFIADTTTFKDHWRDPRWDELPPEWEFTPWVARLLREKFLQSRRLRVR